MDGVDRVDGGRLTPGDMGLNPQWANQPGEVGCPSRGVILGAQAVGLMHQAGMIRVRMDGFDPGQVELAAEKERWINRDRVWVTVPLEGDAAPVTMGLVLGARLYGKVLGENGEPVEGQVVRFTWDGGEAKRPGEQTRSTTDANGLYSFNFVRPDYYKVGLAGRQDVYVDLVLKAGEERELDFDLSGRVILRGRVQVNGGGWSADSFMLSLRPRDKGYPRIWVPDTGIALHPDPDDHSRYSVNLPADRYLLWAIYPDARCLVVDELDLKADPKEQTHDFRVAMADVSVVALTPEGKSCTEGIVCFDQRFGEFMQSRAFSQNLSEKQSLFTDMIAGEYKAFFTSTDNTLTGETDWVKLGPGQKNAVVIDLRSLDRGGPVGGWDSTSITMVEKDHVFPVTALIDGAGEYQAIVDYEWGPCGVRILSACLLENGQEIGRDTHEGWSGTGKRNHIYRFSIPHPRKGAEYSLQVLMKSEGGISSRGTVYWGKRPEVRP